VSKNSKLTDQNMPDFVSMISAEDIQAQPKKSFKKIEGGKVELESSNTVAWAPSIIFMVFSGAYLLSFHSYKQAFDRHAKLTEIYNNPKIRVASGSQAKQLVNSITAERSTAERESERKRADALQQLLLASQESTNGGLKIQNTMI
jgi:hypothetical protein